MPVWLQHLARLFPGIRKNISNFDAVKSSVYCECDGVKFHFDQSVMDRKRFVAIAAGAVEHEEIKVAKRFLNNDDIIIEFGSGIGIAAARVNKAVKPKKHYCFEANPQVIDYATKLFATNKMDIEITNQALGNGETLSFFALQDYILSSFQKPRGRTDFTEINVPTVSLQSTIERLNPTAIFCDVEGAELEYLTTDNWRNVRTVVVELHPNTYGAEGVEKFYDRIKSDGFDIKLTDGDTHCFTRELATVSS